MDYQVYIGATYSRLTVTGLSERKYRNGCQLLRCLCLCGGTTETSIQHLKRGEVQSCGCLQKELRAALGKANRKDLTGMTFGRLTIVKEGSNLGQKSTKWLCSCACGVEKEVASYRLLSGRTRSCGCLASEAVTLRNKQRRIEDPWEREGQVCRSQASYRGLSFSLTPSEFRTLSLGKCHYCGEPPSMTPASIALREKGILKNGIDRKDSSEGYFHSNCVSCCTLCNTAKRDFTYEAFISNTQKRYIHLTSIGVL